MPPFDQTQDKAKLSVVATPIGNLEDITLRALRVLTEADVIFCEDTRVTKVLLDRHNIKTPLKRLDANIETKRLSQVVDLLADGKKVAYVSDAGTPGISDPGYRLVGGVRQALGGSFTIEAIPGPSALVAALSIAGVPADQFIFLGFLPHKKGRQTLLKKIAAAEHTTVLYESTHRIMKLLGELEGVVPERRVIIAREITKKFEEVQAGTPAQLGSFFTLQPSKQRGEFVVIVEAA